MKFVFGDQIFQILVMMSEMLHVFSQMNFTGHRLYRITPTNQKQLDFVEKMKDINEIDVWNDPLIVNQHINVHIPPDLADKLETEWKNQGMNFSLATSDLQQWIDHEKEGYLQEVNVRDSENIVLNQFHTFDTINKFMDAVSKRYSPIAKIEIIGTTYQRNPIKGLKIGTPGVNKPALWIDAGVHAREWMGPATAIYIIDQMIKLYDTDGEIQQLVDYFDWYIFPVINVDGYKYTFTHNRLWRKNRSVSKNKNVRLYCKGVDPNRNFDSAFGGVGTQSNACSSIYRGISPFSEAESKAIRDGVLGIGNRLKAYFSLHAYGKLWLTPYGRTLRHPPDYKDHMKALKAAEDAITKVHGENYKYGPLAKTIYPASSSSVDWVYETALVKYSFGIELRDDGKQGFFLDHNQIVPTGEENFAGIKAVAHLIKKEFG